MAGESPGKPEQKQSSGETAESERDPRLAVFRESPAGPAEPADKAGKTGKAEKAGKAGKADTGGKTDQADTADKADQADTAGGADEAGRAAGSGESGESGEAADGGKAGANGEGRDERLREAVAAWVAAGDDEGASGEGASAEGANGASGADADAAKDTRAKDEAGEAPVTKASADAGSDADAGSEAAVKGAASGSGSEGAAKKAPKSAAKGAPKGGGKSSAAKGEDASGGGSEGAPEAVDQPTAIFKAPAFEEGGDEPADESTRVFSIAKQKASDGAGKGAENGAEADAKPDAKADVKADAKTGKPGAESDAEPEAKPDAKPDSKPDAKSGKSDSKPEGKGQSKGQGKGQSEGQGKGKPSVDQPTTAIKAVRPPGAAESDGERTSQFVALKSTDPQPIKPPRPVGDDKSDKPGKADKSSKTGKAAAAKDAAKTDDEPDTKPGAKPGTRAGAKPGTKAAAEPDVAPGTKWGAKAAAGSGAASATAAGAASGAQPDAKDPDAKGGAAEAPAATPAGATAQPGAQPGALPDSEQTKQQPLPPLDLLAQLTNTPPPPETPMRTVARRFKIWTPLVILLAIIFIVVQQVRPLPDPTLAVGAKSSYTFGGGAFQMPWPGEGQAASRVVGVGDVGTYGPQKPVPTASVAKVMTAHLILKNHPLKPGEQGPKITVDATAVKESGAEDESRVKVKEGQSFTEYQMLQMLLIPSGNNIARQLARWDSPQDEQAFIGKMNAEAKALGMTNTTYTDSSGFKDSTKSTAVDQLKLAEVVMNNEVIRKIVAMPNADVPGLDQRLENNNSRLLIKGTGVLGIKTGSSSPAGGALMWAARRTIDGKPHTIVGVTMDQHFKGLDPNAENSLQLVLDRSYKMLRAVQDAMTSATVVKKGDVVGYVDDGLGGQTPVVATKSLKAVGWPGFKAPFAIDGGRAPVPHEAKAGTVVGQLSVGSGDGRMTVPVALQKDLTEPTFGSKLTRIG
ncbi:hypothetical protein A6A06_38855 [Streptomyces sp. CB02923]|uniref:hypothetical protein n=1 Tax=Streptomyces sp. CB02923 TaxID=1718985 RepID=UPI00093F48F0|nr:hypothetical protein [Streptomyces sp. CB02923]OKI03504.1 hypothetical protein A6A06_38855 [Streptomyces sp. CB02923]